MDEPLSIGIENDLSSEPFSRKEKLKKNKQISSDNFNADLFLDSMFEGVTGERDFGVVLASLKRDADLAFNDLSEEFLFMAKSAMEDIKEQEENIISFKEGLNTVDDLLVDVSDSIAQQVGGSKESSRADNVQKVLQGLVLAKTQIRNVIDILSEVGSWDTLLKHFRAFERQRGIVSTNLDAAMIRQYFVSLQTSLHLLKNMPGHNEREQQLTQVETDLKRYMLNRFSTHVLSLDKDDIRLIDSLNLISEFSDKLVEKKLDSSALIKNLQEQLEPGLSPVVRSEVEQLSKLFIELSDNQSRILVAFVCALVRYISGRMHKTPAPEKKILSQGVARLAFARNLVLCLSEGIRGVTDAAAFDLIFCEAEKQILAEFNTFLSRYVFLEGDNLTEKLAATFSHGELSVELVVKATHIFNQEATSALKRLKNVFEGASEEKRQEVYQMFLERINNFSRDLVRHYKVKNTAKSLRAEMELYLSSLEFYQAVHETLHIRTLTSIDLVYVDVLEVQIVETLVSGVETDWKRVIDILEHHEANDHSSIDLKSAFAPVIAHLWSIPEKLQRFEKGALFPVRAATVFTSNVIVKMLLANPTSEPLASIYTERLNLVFDTAEGIWRPCDNMRFWLLRVLFFFVDFFATKFIQVEIVSEALASLRSILLSLRELFKSFFDVNDSLLEEMIEWLSNPGRTFLLK
eukprot:augustus_masked-scaffold_5-processed-gene-8.26-mRNA-1 protein AED:1.00 eAED:1.00 QI:0/-1/0/0/-1/1/1/0/689